MNEDTTKKVVYSKAKDHPNVQLASDQPQPKLKNQISINVTYPYSDKFTYETRLEKVNLDEERIRDLKTGKGFILDPPRSIKYDVKNQTGIFSNRFGSTIADVDSFNGKYRCQCGYYKGSILHGEICPTCGKMVKYYDDDVTIFGWLILKDRYFYIHPNIFRTLEGFIGAARLNRIIEPDIEVDSDGKIVSIGSIIKKQGATTKKPKKDEPFRGIGLFEFRRRYEEILAFYLEKYPAKTLFYKDLMNSKDMTFTHSIPVFSALLRPSQLEGNSSLKYASVNENFQMISSLVTKINKDKLRIDQKEKEKASLMYDLQTQINLVYNELSEILARKKGDIRSALGGRLAFTSRSVIRQDPYLRCDEIHLPFQGLLELYQQVIINILVKTQNISYSTAYKRWFKAQIKGYDKTIYDILDGLIKDSGGLPFIINRNPTIQYGSILRVRCVGINLNYTMSISLLVLKNLAADFDGDTLNIWALYNKDFINLTDKIFNPVQMYISRNDGCCNGDMLPARDTLINANAIKHISKYSKEELAEIQACLNYPQS